jgi:hypothetical protein
VIRRVYIETSIISYLTARPATSVLAAARQAATWTWWEARDRHSLVTSALVWQECAAGDSEAASRRIAALEGVRMLAIGDLELELASKLIGRGAVPPKAKDDALHIATAARHGVEFLLTWNFKHIANPRTHREIALRLQDVGYQMPVMCSPEELLEGEPDD